MSSTALHRAAAVGVAAAGLVIALGSALPWLTLYGGLHPLRGTMGPYGRALFATGISVALAVAVVLRRPREGGRLLMPVAMAILAFAAWLAFSRLPTTLAALRDNPLLVAGEGPGIYLVMTGATAMLVAAAIGARLPTAPAPMSASNPASSARMRG